jgi:2-polyprenyl-6-hydroxyphenyl methylase / 3-demethylubiquinone-9 3-methyltransferase
MSTRAFYDTYWPRNVPDPARTAEHVRHIVPLGPFRHALDAGCGTGVCSLALAERSDHVLGLDLSFGSLRTARRFQPQLCQASLLHLPLGSDSFDLVFCWGVIHHTSDPVRALDELVRVLEPGGTLVLAVYLRTWLTPVHELVRWLCLRLPPALRPLVVSGVASLVRARARLSPLATARDDNPLIESQVEDWFFVPEKHFFSIGQMASLFAERGLSFELLEAHTGRFRSSSNFVVRGRLHPSNGGGGASLRSGAREPNERDTGAQRE